MLVNEENRKRIIVALDFATEKEVLRLLDRLDPDNCRVKIGKELFTSCGPTLVKKVGKRGFEIFLDLKFHDIPNTVAGAVRAAALELGVWMLNVHASGGKAMLEAAAGALAGADCRRPHIIGVTVLTSLNDRDLSQLGVQGGSREQVVRLARLCLESHLGGVVCSAGEVATLRKELPREFLLVTPGIRRPGDARGDQKRVMGPAEAVAAGADYLVVGRPITRAEDPQAALSEFVSAVSGNPPNPY
ncbi:MAG: orotidine-5'-phosphate decarboxylase [Gammaproteobacteria bacterium]|nr:orotidine-5'-phosphate decarboxylase [Gammaproteobacteria bacterium]MYF00678.1 orotidine-5'-phosphate decarboxylase [Gammaproteobacteria bacterium]